MPTPWPTGPAVCLALITVVSNDEPQMTFSLAMLTAGAGCMGALYSSWIIIRDSFPFCRDSAGRGRTVSALSRLRGPAVAAQIVKGDDSNTVQVDLVWMIAIIILRHFESVFYIIAMGPAALEHPEEGEAGSPPKKGKQDLFWDIVHCWHHPGWNTLCTISVVIHAT